MNFSHDPKKEAANLAKHRISLAEARKLDWDSALVWFDVRKDYGEQRQCALAVMEDRVHAAVFVERDGVWHMISLRKANRREFDKYAAYLDSIGF